MLDVARHFFTVGEVKRYIDLLAMYKINLLHLHLTDDQGWRIEIDSWPRLATYGGSTEVGGGPGGFLTQAAVPRAGRVRRRSGTSRSCPRSTCPVTRTPPWRRTPS